MFANAVTTTPLTGDIQDSVFSRISGNSYRQDVSFTATLRMLLHGRMKEEDKLDIRVREGNYAYREINGAAYDSIMRAFLGGSVSDFDNGTFIVHYLVGASESDRKQIMEYVSANFLENNPGWTHIDEITSLFRKSFGIHCFCNAEKKNTILFVEKMSMKIWHYIQCAVFGYFPWYFERKPGSVSPEEFELVKSFHEETSDKLLACLAKFAEKFDFRAMSIRKLLDGYEKVFLHSEMDACESNQRSMINQINDWEERINEYNKELYDLQIKMAGLLVKLNEDVKESEVMDYFIANKRLVLEQVERSELRFGVKDYLEYFDPEAAKTYIKNRNSFFYCNKPMGYPVKNEDLEKLFKLLFISQKLKIRFCAFYYLDIRGSVQAISHHGFNAEYDCFLPNPHIQGYHCLGGYEREIKKCLKNSDMVGALEQCIASAKSLNFHDTPVMREFMSYFFDTRRKPFIELPDGGVVSPVDAVKWMRAEEARAKEEEERKKREAEEAAARAVAEAEAARKAAEEAAQAVKAESEAATAKPARRRRTKKSVAAESPAEEVARDVAAVAEAAADAMAGEIAEAAEAVAQEQEVAHG